MRIGVISDTHAMTVDELPLAILQVLAEVDLIVHAGDFTHRAVLDGLRATGEVRAVCGNMDSDELRGALPKQDQFVLEGKTVGLVHGWGPPWGIADRVRRLFAGADIIIFGHSHVPWNEFVEETLLLNPGSGRHSYALLTIDEKVRAELIRV